MNRSTTLNPIATEGAMWRAFEARDRGADGLFFVGVTTTGIFCRPSCPSRRPRREHVRFFASAEDARLAGLRACRRCHPDAAVESALARCNAVLASVGAKPFLRWSDRDLRSLDFDPVAVRRAFVEQFGHTFHAHLRALRVSRAHAQVIAGRPISDAGAQGGFESESGLRAAFRAVLDATPTQARHRSMLQMTRIPSPLGALTAAAGDSGVCLLEFDEHEAERPDPGERGPNGRCSSAGAQARLRRIAARLGCVPVVGTNRHLESLAVELAAWFRGERRRFDTPLVLAGSPFEIEVWRRLGTIAFGATASYGEIAAALGRPGAARAVGRANANNPIAILVPCHRVVGATGDLTGYAGGIDRKRWLLAHERRVLRA